MKAAELPSRIQPMEAPVRVFRHEAMATWFELRLEAPDAGYAEQAAQAAFDLLGRLEQRLSRFRANSDVSRVNRAAGLQAVPVNPRTFHLLHRCLELNRLTEGAFDVTATPGGVRQPNRPVLELQPTLRSVFLSDPAFRLDLGGVGKGFALDEMAVLLREWGVTQMLLVGGGSSFRAGADNERGGGWPVRVGGREEPIPVGSGGLGVSGPGEGPHILEPRTGEWVVRRRTTWCVASDGTTSDALSTACMVLDEASAQRVGRRLGAEVGIVEEASV